MVIEKKLEKPDNLPWRRLGESMDLCYSNLLYGAKIFNTIGEILRIIFEEDRSESFGKNSDVG